jgi:hypothetical protein
VIGVGRLHSSGEMESYYRTLETVGIVAPVFAVDVRKKDDVLLLIETLLCILEMGVMEAESAVS